MGTKAVFAIKGYKEKIIGMTSDGFPKNLDWIAAECYRQAKKLKVLTKFKKQDKQVVADIMEAVVNATNEWLFTDDPKNPVWVSHSAELDIKAMSLEHYEGHFEGFVTETKPVVL